MIHVSKDGLNCCKQLNTQYIVQFIYLVVYIGQIDGSCPKLVIILVISMLRLNIHHVWMGVLVLV
jgi:hypothetical protein